MARLEILASAAVLLLAGCVTGTVFHAMDACPGIILCDQLDENFNISGVYVTDTLQEMYCHMESGRWTEVLRRGQDAAHAPLPAADHQTFADPEIMVTGFGEPGTGEFYIGNDNLTQKVAVPLRLKVELLGQDDVRYFSVFDGFSATGNPLQLTLGSLQYRMGTAGDGGLAALDGAVYNGACAPTAWFGLTEPCDLTASPGPALTMPLIAENQRDGRTPWPTLPVELKAVSMQLHTQPPTDACLGLDQHFAFHGDVLTTIEDTVPSSVRPGQSFTISCKNTSWILPTVLSSMSDIPNSVTFTCGPDAADPTVVAMDNHPLIPGKPCMAPCPDGYSLYIPGQTTPSLSSAPERATCLSPPSTEPARSLVEAAQLCGQRGEQLLDFGPDVSYLPGLDTTQPLWIWMLQESPGTVTQLNSREEQSGQINRASAMCGQLSYSASPATVQSAECHADTLGSNNYKNYVCMTAVGCGPDAVFHRGFCYHYDSTATAADHVSTCTRRRGSTPADYTAEFVAEALPKLGVPTDGQTPFVGIYKRYGKFWRPDGTVVPVTEFVGDSYGDDTLQCAAVLPTDPTKLEPVNCATDTDHIGVICQTPGYGTVSNELCSVRYDQLLNASSSGPAPTVTRAGSMPTAVTGDAVTFTCPDGYNVHNVTALHAMTLTCGGLQSGWQYPAELDVALHGMPVECVFACSITEASRPRNSELVTVGQDSVFRCSGYMQTADGSTEQLAVCDHTTAALAAGLQPCDHCLGAPLIPGPNSTVVSSWDDTSRLEGTVVNYTCVAGLQTPDGLTVQNQTCTSNGWVGEVVPCSYCVPLDEERLLPAVSTLSGPQAFGALANLSCPAGLQSSDGSLSTSASCLPSSWEWCLPDFNCSFCSGNPPNVSSMITITSDWDGTLRELGTTVLYTCAAGLEAVDGSTQQTANCTGVGWVGDVLPCDVCSNPPNGSHPTISTTLETGGGTLGASLEFVCNDGLSVEDGSTRITSVCTETGWTNCSQDIKCEYCTPLPHLPDGTMNWGSYAGETALDTEVTLTCNPGLAVAGSLAKTQTVVCGLNGWNHTAVQSCTVCDQDPPVPSASMSLSWALGDSQAVYQCPNDTMLPWGEVTYLMQCSPDGWSDCVPECTACVFPPAAGPGAVLVSMNVSRGGISRYECNANLTSAGPTELELTCGETGWTEAEMIVCDMCNGNLTEAGPSQNRTGNTTGLLGSSLTYECIHTMGTVDGKTEQTMACTEQGWTRPPEPCDHCPLPRMPDGVNQTWDLPENLTSQWVPIGTNVTFYCSNVTATLASNSTEQTLNCTAEGWSGTVEPCVSCLDDIPDPGNGTEARNVTWDEGRHEGAVVLYTCQNGAQHEIRCVDRQWLPAELGPCEG
ncbi:uncharacterized protein LOC122367030 isoform X2 [Amphibalanus amphitrite]|uniref:uncharacterized protein LOC122367030 isoform X2 n=1 Tax=Amphibalanus amphitrite TaxID=1232801 RepID=UPI001C903F69|nr:uncharacterized protein LOC122367030 isoform X2 [Amphibalanus amphitrite]